MRKFDDQDNTPSHPNSQDRHSNKWVPLSEPVFKVMADLESSIIASENMLAASFDDKYGNHVSKRSKIAGVGL